MAAPLAKLCSRNVLIKQSLPSVRCISHGSCLQQASSQTIRKKEATDHAEIKVPKKKKRDRTTVLRALASTVSKDFHGPHYKYIDDPFLIPSSSLEKRTFSLAKASGQRAAQYVVQNFPQYFERTPIWNFEDKLPEVYMPARELAHPEASVEGLAERIALRRPVAAFQAYQALRQNDVEVPADAVHELLELLCCFNSDDPPHSFLPDETFFKRDVGQDNRKKITKTWKDNGLAEQLFKEMPERTSRACIALIRGRAKYYQVDQAYQLFTEMKEAGLAVDLSAYNAILGIVSLLKDGPPQRWELQKELLGEMASRGLQPDLTTFNNVLFVLTRASNHPDSPVWAMQTVNEMRRCAVEPSLASWYYMLQIVYQGGQASSRLLSEIVGYLEGQERLVLRDIEDFEFFHTAMNVCNQTLQDLELAYRVDALVNKDNNLQLLGDGYREGMYYTNLMQVACMYEQIDDVMKVYERITPHSYSPTFKALDDLLGAIELNDGERHLPKLWSDLVQFDYLRRQDIIEKLVSVMARRRQADPGLQDTFVDIAAHVRRRFEEDTANPRLNKPLQITGPMAGNLAVINLHANHFDNAWEFYRMFETRKRDIEGFPSESALGALAEACMERSDLDKALAVLGSMADLAYPKADTLAETLRANFALTDQQKMQLEDML